MKIRKLWTKKIYNIGPRYRGVTCKDVRDIMPTVLILLGGLLIMIFVIPYAFSSVIKQLEAEQVIIKTNRV